MTSLTLHITGMTCGHCRARVEQALTAAPGVRVAWVDLERGVADVEFDPGLTGADGLIEAVRGAGYDARAAAGQ